MVKAQVPYRVVHPQTVIISKVSLFGRLMEIGINLVRASRNERVSVYQPSKVGNWAEGLDMMVLKNIGLIWW